MVLGWFSEEKTPLENLSIIYIGEVPDLIREELIERLPKGFNLQFYSDYDKQKKNEALRNCNFILGFPRSFTIENLKKCKKLSMVQLLSAGYDYFDVEAAAKMHVAVANNGGANSVAVAEHTILMILALYKKLEEYQQALRKGNWYRKENHPLELYELKGKQVGIIGFGNIGQNLTKCLQGFEVEAKYYDLIRNKNAEVEYDIEFIELKELIKTSDIISIHVPLLKSTKKMISAQEFDMMKTNAILINTARGGIVDDEALYEALITGKIAGAGLDVFTHENEIQEGTFKSPLFNLKNIIVTPHYAGHTLDTWHRRIRNGYQNIINYTKGKPDWIVNRHLSLAEKGK
jgi:phosphoglycerate dehydrogenase-like enzyme